MLLGLRYRLSNETKHTVLFSAQQVVALHDFSIIHVLLKEVADDEGGRGRGRERREVLVGDRRGTAQQVRRRHRLGSQYWPWYAFHCVEAI